jgi:branched-subunit amino acid transport protein AzlD
MASAPVSRTPRAIAAAAALALSVPLNAFGAQTAMMFGARDVRRRMRDHGEESSAACGGQNVPVTNRAVIAGLGVVYVAASTVTPLVLKTTPSDLDVYFWPSAETIVSGHPLAIYSTTLNAIFFNDNGPVGLIPLVPIAALANALGWAGSLAGRAALTGAVVSLFVLLLAYQAVGYIASARGGVRRPLVVACAVLLAPAVWIAVFDYGHIEQPVELCLVLVAMTSFLSRRDALTGIALGAAMLTRTIAGFCMIPLVLAPLATHRRRQAVTLVCAAVVTVGAGIVPFFVADAQAAAHALVTYRGNLPIGGGTFWIIAQQAPWAGLVQHGDVYLGAAVAIALVAVTLRRKPSVATTHTGLIGLITVASCCFPLFAKSVFPYYLLEPYVFAVMWWLARSGSARNWRAVVPLLLTLDVFVVRAALTSPSSTWGIVASLVSSATVGVALALVTLDLLRSTENVSAAREVLHDHPSRSIATAQDAK